MTKTEVFFNTLNLENLKVREYILDKNIVINNVKMNSKELKEGDLFVGIRGGNNYILEAIKHNCYVVYDDKNIVIEKEYENKCFLVKDSILFLQEFAKKWRENLDIKVIGITGSNGKTTVKDMVFNLLISKMKGKKTEGNLNNHIGLPFTLLRSEKDDDFIILEMGMSDFGEIDLLGKISKPDVGIITNIGESHLEYLKSKENVMRAKCEIIPHIKDKLIVNGDDSFLKNIEIYMEKNFNCLKDIEVIKVLNENFNEFREKSKNFYYGDIFFNELGSKFVLKYYGRRCKNNIEKHFETNVVGVHNILNLTIALAVAKILFVEDKYLENTIKNIVLTNMRFEKIEKGNIIYINDAYNASPLSMEKSMETFSKLYNDRGKIAVLGDMLELGEEEVFYHENLSDVIFRINVQKIYLYGNRMKFLYNKLIELSESSKKLEIKHFDDKDGITEEIKRINGKLAVLVKASRGMKLEEIIKN